MAVTLVPTMLTSISSEFNKSNEASWVGTSYLLATCTFTPLYGRLCNVMGRSAANQSAVLFAAAGIMACGLSKSMQMLIISRFISGMGGGGIFTTSSIITSDMYSLRHRSFIQSVGGIFYGLGMGLGGPVGGLITDWYGWRWAFLGQMPFFALSYLLTVYNLTYIISGTGIQRSTKEILKRIDYLGSLTLLGCVGSMLLFLSMRFSEGLPWIDLSVWGTFSASVVFGCLFLLVEIYVAVEPVLPPHLLTEKVPILVGCSNALVAVCNLSVTYFFPTWFQTVMLTSASEAGLHLLPNSICISTGSVFAGWIMRRSGSYKSLNMLFGILPFCATLLMINMKEDSHPALLWFTIMPLGFGNAIVLQTMFMALVANIPESQMAVGTGFAQLLRGLGQVGGLALASAVFQSRLDVELHRRLPPGSEDLISRIRHSARLVAELPPDVQRSARDAYAASLKAVFMLAACASLLAYLARLPIPDKHLDDKPRVQSADDNSSDDAASTLQGADSDDDESKKSGVMDSSSSSSSSRSSSVRRQSA
ncbi:major facilitator superfamily domain-containing protein [Panaeolus papilionaceus]|nr:major facilitator superfamily domain-containing protein [Panaeolus papilionaceus]